MFLEVLQNSKENTVPDTLFNEVAGLRLATLLKKSLSHRYFPMNFAKFLRTRFSQNTSAGCFWKKKSLKRFYNHLWLLTGCVYCILISYYWIWSSPKFKLGEFLTDVLLGDKLVNIPRADFNCLYWPIQC